MYLAIRQNNTGSKLSTLSRSHPLRQPQAITQSQITQNQYQQTQRQETFNLTVTDRRTIQQPQQRMIKRSMINRSCINTLSFCYKQLKTVPRDLTEKGSTIWQNIQKLDLSFNHITDLHKIKFQRFTSLKELILNDNSISQLPFTEINHCKGLKLVNLNNNQLYILPTLWKVSYIQARNNPLRLVTSELARLPHLQFATFDWIDYLIESQQQDVQDKYQRYIKEFNKLKTEILSHINYDLEENMNYCDFHCFFSVKLQQNSKKPIQNAAFVSNLIVKSMYKNDDFFINYLRNFQNELNYANMRHNYKLLLETVFQNGDNDILELFMLKKDNYSLNINEQIYFQSIRLCCYYSHYKMFKFLIHIQNRREKIMNVNKVMVMIQDILQRYDKDKQSFKILSQLIMIYKEYANQKIMIQIPEEYNAKIYRSMSMALLDIKNDEDMYPFFEIDTGQSRSSPLFFAMRSKNQELLTLFLKQNWDVFQRNQSAFSCKYTYGSTQISRKMIWKKQKKLIKKHWDSCSQSLRSSFKKNDRETMQKEQKSFALGSQNSDVAEEFAIFSKPKSSGLKSPKRLLSSSQPIQKCIIQDEVLPYLFIRAKQIVNLKWNKHYSKKIDRMEEFIDYLQLLKRYEDNSFLKRLQLWKKIMERLVYLFENLQNETPLLQYEIIQVNEFLRQMKQDRALSSVRVQKQKIGMNNGSFWCCKNVVYQ